ncbi:MAG: hypothetical protein JF597_31080 [Streptomyces sp.]|uniref:hypothetical protein n=1 Tax=Streptomyces sp. TaxID=1931 RepID=UPI0025F64D57|nr:hypothetical protein [Streptomyces sp.]MBW8797870.1 hypothetical protein [Streptomyces sp.]
MTRPLVVGMGGSLHTPSTSLTALRVAVEGAADAEGAFFFGLECGGAQQGALRISTGNSRWRRRRERRTPSGSR